MKRPSFDKQLLIVLFTSIAFTMIFSFFFIHYLYTELYLSSVEDSIISQGEWTASHYHYGQSSDDIIEKIQWYSVVSDYEIIVVDQLENLSTYFPYQLDYEALVNEKDKEILEIGKYVMKKGYVEELDKEIVGAIFPIRGKEEFIGFIYIYVPLADITEIYRNSIPTLTLVGSLFFIVLIFIVKQIWQSMFSPLAKLQNLAKEVSRGNYSNQIEVERDDEIGELTKAFNQMSRSLKEQEERKKEFTSNIVHELRTPLTYIRGYTDVLKKKHYESPEEAKHYLTTIEKETERLNKLINDLVDLNHMQEEMYTLDKQPIAIAQTLLDTVDLFSIHLLEKNLDLNLDVDEELIISGDEQRIHQVFYNTIDNAIKYSFEGETISITLKKKKKVVEYKINNKGITIKEEDLDRIGERFFRTDKARTRTTGGTGLGLSIVKEIVRLHDGTCLITSEDENGTTVTIQLPQFELD